MEARKKEIQLLYDAIKINNDDWKDKEKEQGKRLNAKQLKQRAAKNKEIKEERSLF